MLRPTVQSASPSWYQAPIWGLRPDFYFCQTVAGLLMWGALSDERTCLQFTIAAGPRQCSHSWVRVPRDSWPYFTVSDSRPPNLEGQVPVFISPQEQGGPVIPPGTGFHFCRHLWLAGGINILFPSYDTDRKENNASNHSIVACVFVAMVIFLPSRYVATIRGYTYR
jgi:hypothetical protein